MVRGVGQCAISHPDFGTTLHHREKMESQPVVLGFRIKQHRLSPSETFEIRHLATSTAGMKRAKPLTVFTRRTFIGDNMMIKNGMLGAHAEKSVFVK